MKAIVIGGGVVGLNVALSLQSRGFNVILFENRDKIKPASYGNAGHIATEQVEPLASMAMVRSVWRRLFLRGGPLSLPPKAIAAWLPFSLRLLQAAQASRFARGKVALKALLAEAMPAWQRRVSDIGAPDLLCEGGHYVVWEGPESAARGLKSWQGSDTGTARFSPVSAAEMAQLSALTSKKIHGAIRFAGTAQIADTQRLLDTLERTFVSRGGLIHYDRVARLEIQAHQAGLMVSDGTIVTADAIVVSAGVGSRPLMESIGLKTPMIAERGYHIQSLSPQWPQGLPPVVFEDRSMIVTGFETGLRAASFVEFAQANTPPDERKWHRLRTHVRDLGLPFEETGATEWFGARPTLPDYLPAIGRVSKAPNLYYAFGHQHLGLTLAPVTAEIVADMIDSGEGPKAFDLMRFN